MGVGYNSSLTSQDGVVPLWSESENVALEVAGSAGGGYPMRSTKGTLD